MPKASTKRGRKDEPSKGQKSKAKKAKKRQQVNVNHIIQRLQGLSSHGGNVDADVVNNIVQSEVRRMNHECFIPDWMWQPLFDFQEQVEIDRNLTLCKAAVPAARRKTNMNKNLLEDLALKKVFQPFQPHDFCWRWCWYWPDPSKSTWESDRSIQQKFGNRPDANCYCWLVVTNFFQKYTQKEKLRLLGRANRDCTKELCQATLDRYLADSVDDSNWPGCKWKTKKARDKALEQWRLDEKNRIKSSDQRAKLLTLIVDTFVVQEGAHREASRFGPLLRRYRELYDVAKDQTNRNVQSYCPIGAYRLFEIFKKRPLEPGELIWYDEFHDITGKLQNHFQRGKRIVEVLRTEFEGWDPNSDRFQPEFGYPD